MKDLKVLWNSSKLLEKDFALFSLVAMQIYFLIVESLKANMKFN